MVRQTIIALLILLLACSCGQVGVITGGPVDRTAPRPISEEIEPPMASKNVKPEKITIPFEEFISLNNPSQNIRVVPGDVTLTPKIRKKSLILEVSSGEWKDTTTYAVYLKRAVKDITEGNDSLMIYVFSTGNTIDSLVSAVHVVDAYTDQPVKDVTVGLYLAPLEDDTSKVLPRYIAQTDGEGKADFKYLKEGPFYTFAFKDENKDNYLNFNEKRGRLFEELYADTVIKEELPEIRLMPPPPPSKLKVRTNEVFPPSVWTLAFNQSVKKEISFNFLNHEPIGTQWNEKGDSVVVYYGNLPRSSTFKTALSHPLLEDTISKKFIFKDAFKYDFKTNLANGVLNYKDTFWLALNEAIKEVDTSKIRMRAKKEDDENYTDLPVDFRLSEVNKVEFVHDLAYDSIEIVLHPEALNGFNVLQEDTLEIKYLVQDASKVGNLIIEMDTIPPYGILEVLDTKERIIRSFVIAGDKEEVQIKGLQPGDYKFRFVLDENKDGEWTTGDVFKKIPAERVIRFREASTIRANWDVKTTLEFMEYYYEVYEPKNEEEQEEEEQE